MRPDLSGFGPSVSATTHSVVLVNQFFGKQNRMKELLSFVFFGFCDVCTPVRADFKLPTVKQLTHRTALELRASSTRPFPRGGKASVLVISMAGGPWVASRTLL